MKKTNPLIHFGFKQSVLNPVIHFGFESIHLGLSYEDSVLPQGPTEGSQHNSFYGFIQELTLHSGDLNSKQVWFLK